MIGLQIIFICIHFLAVLISAVLLLFSNNINILCIQLLVQTLVYMMLCIHDGCTLSKLEYIGGNKFNSTFIGKKFFFIGDNTSNLDFEKLIVGIPLGLLFLKILFNINKIDKLLLIKFPFLFDYVR